MLTLDDTQWRGLQALDEKNFVAAVCDQFLVERQDRAANPGRQGVLDRMQHAYAHAQGIGLTSTPHIVQFLYLAADAPRFYERATIDHQLRKPGAAPEQRWDDLMAVVHKKLDGGL